MLNTSLAILAMAWGCKGLHFKVSQKVFIFRDEDAFNLRWTPFIAACEELNGAEKIRDNMDMLLGEVEKHGGQFYVSKFTEFGKWLWGPVTPNAGAVGVKVESSSEYDEMDSDLLVKTAREGEEEAYI